MEIQYIIRGKITPKTAGVIVSFRAFPQILTILALIGFSLFLIISVVYFLQGYDNITSIAGGIVACVITFSLVIWQGCVCVKKFQIFLGQGCSAEGQGDGLREP